VTNLASKVSFTAFQKQLFDELKQQDDPCMFGNGHILEEYPSADTVRRGLCDKYLRGEEVNPGNME